MAVYTTLTNDDAKHVLSYYAIGSFVTLEGIAAGIENTNYRLTTSEGTFILTIYEKRVDKENLPFYLDLQSHLARNGIPCPLPVETKDGDTIITIKNKPAAIVTFLNGKSTNNVQIPHLNELGTTMAQLHTHAKALNDRGKPNPYSLPCWQTMANEIGHQFDEVRMGLSNEVHEALDWISASWPTNLPSGIIHADLFPDNVFFQGPKLSGVIDFYFACQDAWMYDVAITLNAWCFENDREFNMTKARTLLSAYNTIRPITDAEWEALPVLASGAALRFLLTRSYDWVNPVEGAVVTPKKPMEYLHKIRFHHGISSYKEYGV